MKGLVPAIQNYANESIHDALENTLQKMKQNHDKCATNKILT